MTTWKDIQIEYNLILGIKSFKAYKRILFGKQILVSKLTGRIFPKLRIGLIRKKLNIKILL